MEGFNIKAAFTHLVNAITVMRNSPDDATSMQNSIDAVHIELQKLGTAETGDMDRIGALEHSMTETASVVTGFEDRLGALEKKMADFEASRAGSDVSADAFAELQRQVGEANSAIEDIDASISTLQSAMADVKAGLENTGDVLTGTGGDQASGSQGTGTDTLGGDTGQGAQDTTAGANTGAAGQDTTTGAIADTVQGGGQDLGSGRSVDQAGFANSSVAQTQGEQQGLGADQQRSDNDAAAAAGLADQSQGTDLTKDGVDEGQQTSHNQ